MISSNIDASPYIAQSHLSQMPFYPHGFRHASPDGSQYRQDLYNSNQSLGKAITIEKIFLRNFIVRIMARKGWLKNKERKKESKILLSQGFCIKGKE